MKNKLKLTGIALIVAIVFMALACTNPADPQQQLATGSITGKAVFANSADNSGITITLEQTDGLRSAAVIDAQRSIAEGASVRAMSINGARSIAGTAKTTDDGSYTLKNVPAGTYTLYASSQDSLEKAVTRNVTVRANEVFDAGTLNLTPVGSISGQIIVDDGSDSAMGFLVSVAGTSFMAVTGSDGSFTISGIPAGNNYLLIIIKGNYTAFYTETAQSVTGGGNNTLQAKNITARELFEGSDITIGANGNWYINGVDTGISAKGDKGDTGTPGSVISIVDGYWHINGTNTGVPTQGPKGDKGEPGEIDSILSIGANGNWFINDIDTGIPAQGPKGDTGDKGDQGDTGAPGSVISIGPNGNWFIDGADTGKKAQGDKGESGTPGSVITIGTNGNWFIDGEDTGMVADITGGVIMLTVTFNTGGGSAVPTQYLVYGEKATRPANPVQDGFTFDNWYNDSTLSTLYDFDATITANIMVYAKWTYLGLPITVVSDIASYLANQGGGGSADNPVILPVNVELTSTNWTAILTAINSGDKYVDLDLARCTISSSNTGGGLRTDGTFDPAASTFNGKNRIVSLILPDMATAIVAGTQTTSGGTTTTTAAFNYFTFLESVSGKNIATINNYAFYNCIGLTNASFPTAATISANAFNGCTALAEVSIPNLVSIGASAFSGCTSLTNVSFPKAATISANAFTNCPLRDIEFGLITIPADFSATYLANRANVTRMSFPQATGIADGSLTMSNNTIVVTAGSFNGCTALAEVSIPNLINIGNFAFSGCTGLTNVSFPNVTSVGEMAFYNCTSLTNVNFPLATSIGNSATDLGATFHGCTALAEASFPKVTSIGLFAFRDTGTIALTVSMGNQAPSVGREMFYNVTATKNVTVKVPAGATGYTSDWIYNFTYPYTVNVEIVYEE